MDTVTGEKRSIDEALTDRIDKLTLSRRLEKAKEDYLDAKPHVCSEVNVSFRKSWEETEGGPIERRFAKAFEKILEEIPVVINDWELLVGSETRFMRGAYIPIHFDAGWGQARLDEGSPTMGAPGSHGILPKKERQILQDCIDFFRNKTAGELMREVRAVGGNWYEDVADLGGIYPEESATSFEVIPMFDKILATGLQGIIEEAGVHIQKFAELAEDDPRKLWFWQSAIITCKAVIGLARRYAQRARELSLKERDAARRAELEEIAEICERVPEKPARTFHEAVQSVWFILLARRFEDVWEGINTGRPDQYLYPYFKRDLERGQLTLEKAAAIIGDLIVHLGRAEMISAKALLEGGQATIHENVTLGGVTRTGEDAYNELTHLILHVGADLKFAEPHISLSWHKGLAHKGLMKAIETAIKMGGGHPQFTNGDHMVRYFVDRGIPLEDARDWGFCACTNAFPISLGTDVKFAVGPLNMALVLDVTLHNSIAPRTGKQIGLDTGDPREFATFSDLYEAFKEQYAVFVRKLVRYHHRNFCRSVDLYGRYRDRHLDRLRAVLRAGRRVVLQHSRHN